MTFSHQPVLLTETLDLLDPQPGDLVLDCTLGGGGHSRAIWDRLQGQVDIIGIDQDELAVEQAKESLPPQIRVVHDNFSNLLSVLAYYGVTEVNRILFDLGVSSPQLDQGERGFSYQQDAPLDMRMDRRRAKTAHQLVNQLSAEELAEIIWQYGEERWAKRIAQFIVTHRAEAGSIDTTGQLVEIIKQAIPAGARRAGPHPAKRTFQALRIAVNDELEILEGALRDAVTALAPGGRLAVISFHSLEDRIVKQTFRQLERGCTCPPGLPLCVCGQNPVVKSVTRRPVTGSEAELTANPRARSAKLRVIEKLPSQLSQTSSPGSSQE